MGISTVAPEHLSTLFSGVLTLWDMSNFPGGHSATLGCF